MQQGGGRSPHRTNNALSLSWWAALPWDPPRQGERHRSSTKRGGFTERGSVGDEDGAKCLAQRSSVRHVAEDRPRNGRTAVMPPKSEQQGASKIR